MANYNSPYSGAQFDQVVEQALEHYAVEVVDKTASHTFVAADNGKDFHFNSASNLTATIQPASAGLYAPRTYFFITRRGTGTLAFVAGAGVVFYASGNKLKVAEQYDTLCARYLGDDKWLITGNRSL